MKNIVGNWTVAPVYTYESPQYATVQSGRDSNLNNDAAADRAIVNPAGNEKAGTDVTALTNSAGETVGYLANDPTARYIRAGLGSFPNAGRGTIPNTTWESSGSRLTAINALSSPITWRTPSVGC